MTYLNNWKHKTCLALVLLAVVLPSCRNNATPPQQEDTQQTSQELFIPAPPDYADPVMWTMGQNNSTEHTADVFYVPSTWEYDWTTSAGMVCHYADVYNQCHRNHMGIETGKVAQYMADGNNFYAPFYRHITLNTWATLNEDTINQRYHSVSWADVQAAFSYYTHHYNHGKPFILAGFSQGAKSVVELLNTLTPELQQRMVAAYVLGYKVTPQDVADAPWIKAAQGADDTGVTICYNSVSDVQYTKPVVSAPNVMCINPVNWRTDSTPATLQDTITVTLDPDHKVLVVKGYDGSSLPNILDILNVGDYHGVEPWLYSECLRKNFKQRISAWVAAHDD